MVHQILYFSLFLLINLNCFHGMKIFLWMFGTFLLFTVTLERSPHIKVDSLDIVTDMWQKESLRLFVGQHTAWSSKWKWSTGTSRIICQVLNWSRHCRWNYYNCISEYFKKSHQPLLPTFPSLSPSFSPSPTTMYTSQKKSKNVQIPGTKVTCIVLRRVTPCARSFLIASMYLCKNIPN